MDYIYYYRYKMELFGVIEEYDSQIKVQSLESKKTYDIEKDWVVDSYEKGNLELSKNGLDF